MTFQGGFHRNAVLSALVLLTLASFGCSQSPQAKSAKFVERGKQLLAKNDVAKAVLQFRNAARATPNDPDVIYQLASALLREGDLRDGVAYLRKTLQINPRHQEAQLRLAQLMASTRDPDLLKDAQKRLGDLLASESSNPEVLHALATTELKLGEPQDAIQHLQQALAAAPSDISLALNLALAKLQGKDAKGAEEILAKLAQNSPHSPDAATYFGEFLMAQGSAAEAEQQFRRAMGIDPKYAPALADLAVLQNSTGRKADAERTFQSLSRLEDTRFQHFYGVFLLQAGRNTEAVREFERLAKANRGDRMARTRLVLAYKTTGRLADAEKVLEDALRKNGKDQDALLQRSEIFIGQGKFVQAEADINEVLHQSPNSEEAEYILAQFHRARGQMPSYRADLNKVLELSPFMLNVRLELARALLADNDAKSAIGVLDGAPQFQKSMGEIVIERNWALWAEGDLAGMRKGINQLLEKSHTAEALLQDALCKLREGDSQGARASAEESLKLNPQDTRALDALNQTYVARKQEAQGLEALRQYAARYPKSAALQQFVGMVLLAHGDRTNARAAFQAAKAADPSNWKADHSLVELDFLEEKWDEAEARLKALTAANPADSKARLWLGHVEMIKGNKKAALHDYQAVIDDNPNDPMALNNLASLLTDAGRTDEGLKYAQRAQELAPDDPNVSDTLGWALYQKGLYPSALQYLERAAGSARANPVAGYHLAMAYAKTGDVKRAQSSFNAARKRNPELPEAKLAADLLAGKD